MINMNEDILQRYIEGKVSTKEKDDIAAWLDTDEKHMEEFMLLRKIHDASLWTDPVDMDKREKTKTRQLQLILRLTKFAAVFLLGIVSYHYIFSSLLGDKQEPVTTQTIYVPEAQRAEVMLADGTKVWLNGKTKFTFPNQFNDKERKVELNGEAYFDVARDESKQFIVNTGAYKVKVLGTEFNVKAYPDKKIFETSLISGSVEVFSDYTGESIRISPNEKLYFKNETLIEGQIQNPDQFLWREGLIVFEHESVKNILDQLEYYYDVKVVVNNRKILQDYYTGKFRIKDGVEHALKVLQLRHDLTYHKDINSNVITIN